MERGRADYLGMAFYVTRERANWLHTGARGCSGAVIFALPDSIIVRNALVVPS